MAKDAPAPNSALLNASNIDEGAKVACARLAAALGAASQKFGERWAGRWTRAHPGGGAREEGGIGGRVADEP